MHSSYVRSIEVTSIREIAALFDSHVLPLRFYLGSHCRFASDDGRFETDRLEYAKEQRILKDGFKRSNDGIFKIEAGYEFCGYRGAGRIGFHLTIIIAWDFDALGFRFQVSIGKESMTSSPFPKYRHTRIASLIP